MSILKFIKEQRFRNQVGARLEEIKAKIAFYTNVDRIILSGAATPLTRDSAYEKWRVELLFNLHLEQSILEKVLRILSNENLETFR